MIKYLNKVGLFQSIDPIENDHKEICSIFTIQEVNWLFAVLLVTKVWHSNVKLLKYSRIYNKVWSFAIYVDVNLNICYDNDIVRIPLFPVQILSFFRFLENRYLVLILISYIIGNRMYYSTNCSLFSTNSSSTLLCGSYFGMVVYFLYNFIFY